MTPRSEAICGLLTVANGLRKLDEHFATLPIVAQEWVNNSNLRWVDAASVLALVADIETIEEKTDA